MIAEMKITLITNSKYSISNYEKLNLSYYDDKYIGAFEYIDDTIDMLKLKLKNKLENIFKNIKADTHITYDLLDLFKSILEQIDNVNLNNLNDDGYIESSLHSNYKGNYIKIHFSDFKMKDVNNVWLVIHNHEYGYEILKAFDTEQAAKNYKRFYGIKYKNLNSIKIIEIPVESDSKLFTAYDEEND